MSERAVTDDEQRLGALPAGRDRLEQGRVQSVTEGEVEGRDVAGGARVRFERLAQRGDGGGEITAAERSPGEGDAAARGPRPEETAVHAPRGPSPPPPAPQRRPRLSHSRPS